MRLLLPKTPDSTVEVTWDFTSQLPSGVTIISATINVLLLSGIDATPETMAGAPDVATTPLMVSALINGGIDGNIYVLECLATCTDGEVVPLQASILVRAILP